jgi:hypothetical protein
MEKIPSITYPDATMPGVLATRLKLYKALKGIKHCITTHSAVNRFLGLGAGLRHGIGLQLSRLNCLNGDSGTEPLLMLRMVPLAEIRKRKSSRCLVTRCTSEDAVRSTHSQPCGSEPACSGASKYAETRFWSRQGMTVDVKMPSFDQLLVFGCITL